MPNTITHSPSGKSEIRTTQSELHRTTAVDVSDQNAALGIDPIIDEAVKRWNRCAEWEAQTRVRFLDDLRFEQGDSDNGYQWPNAIKRSREVDSRPCLTMNVIHQHNLQISNSARKNKSSVKYLPQGNGATVASAEVLKQLARRIENISKAQNAYTQARNFQVAGGVGYWRIVTDYVSQDSFDQEIYIKAVDDPLSIFLDPDREMTDPTTGRFAFVFDNMPKGDFREKYPQWYGKVGLTPLPGTSATNDWIAKDHIRVCEYFRKVLEEDKVVSFVSQGVRRTILKSKLPTNISGPILKDPLTKVRDTKIEKIEWYLIAGDQIIDETEWIGKFIPIIPVYGSISMIDGIYDVKGHTRSMKDAQRMYNYNASSQVEFVALQGKTPWVASAQAIEEYESMWNTANTVNHSVLLYNGVDDQGNPIPPPARTQPPNASPAYEAGMTTAFNQIMMVSGQWQNQMGMMGNERTGDAIRQRRQQSETSVFHFQDNYEAALVLTGEMLLDLIPKVYDTQRVLMVMGDNEEPFEVRIDPRAQQAFQMEQDGNSEAVSSIFNPMVGKYSVSPSVGPAYGTAREETSESLSLLLTQAPQLVPIIGDLMMSSLDFDKAQEAAQRLKRMVPPQALGLGPSQAEMELKQQVMTLQGLVAKGLQKGAKDELKLVGKEQMRDIDVYEAETKRLAAMQKLMPLDQEGLKKVVEQLVTEIVSNGGLQSIVEANKDDIDVDSKDSGGAASGAMFGPQGGGGGGPEAPPLNGAKRAPDGEWYMPDPTRPGKHLKLVKAFGG